MKMKQSDVVNLVREFAKKAGYDSVTVEHIEPDEPSKNWIVEISGVVPAFNEYVKKAFLVNDDTQAVSFKRPSSEELKGPPPIYKVLGKKEDKKTQGGD